MVYFVLYIMYIFPIIYILYIVYSKKQHKNLAEIIVTKTRRVYCKEYIFFVCMPVCVCVCVCYVYV